MPLTDPQPDALATEPLESLLPADQHAGLVAGLMARAASISPKYFYDDRGSALFEQITRLPEYYPTRTEQQIMAAHGADIARHIAPDSTVIEWGAGNCEKALQLCALLRPARFVGLDISKDCLRAGACRLQAAYPAMQVHACAADLTHDWALPDGIPLARRVVYYPGSSIGNFAPGQALELLQRMRSMLGDDGALLIGLDLVKPVAVLEAAYNDSTGVTAAFNSNVLSHVNRLIGSDFDEDDWEHRSFFNSRLSRIEMHLRARHDVVVRWPGQVRQFAHGECIHTENSYKFRADGLADWLGQAGFSRVQPWTDAQRWFAVVLAQP